MSVDFSAWFQIVIENCRQLTILPPMSRTQETLRVLRSQSLSSVVQNEIEQRILSGAIEAGLRVNENGLAAELGVSRWSRWACSPPSSTAASSCAR
jgi:hypothetical protein